MVKLFFSLAFLLITINYTSFAQQFFIKGYEDLGTSPSAHPYSFSLAIDGNYYIAATGYDYSSTYEGLFIIKTDPLGDTLWSKLFQLPQNIHIPRTILATPDSGCIVGGDGFIFKMDKDGNSQWVKYNFNKSIISIAKTPAGYLVGAVDLPVNISGSCCSYILKFSDGGYMYNAYSRTVNGPTGNGQSWLYQLNTLRNGDYLISSASYGHTSPVADTYLTDTTLKCYATISGEGSTTRSIQASDGSVVMLYKSGYGPQIVKFDTTGHKYWEKNFRNDFQPMSIDTIAKGGVIIAGKMFGTSQTFISKIDSNGMLLNTYLTCCIDTPVVRSTNDGGFASIGMDSLNYGRILLNKADSIGGCLQIFSDTLNTIIQTPTNYWPFIYLPFGVGGYPLTMADTIGSFINGGSTIDVCYSLGTKTNLLHSSFKIYPNPANTNLNIEFITLPVKNNELIISDISGKVILIFNSLLSKNSIDISKLPSGIYVVKIITSGSVQFQKFVKK